MSTVYLFNPENDMALASGSPYYMAPANIKKMAADLSALPAWYALPGSGVLVSDARQREWMLQEYGTILEVDWLLEVPDSCDRICPWGWNSALLRRLGELGVPEGLLLSNEQMSRLRALSSRQMAVELLPRLRVEQTLGEANLLTSLENLKAFEAKGERVLLKSPWSGSGKGIRMVEDLSDPSVYGWAKRVISSQGAIVVEPYYNKVVDFAMEFYVGHEGVSFVGYSFFETDCRGIYKGNVLASNVMIEQKLSEYVSVNILECVRQKCMNELAHVYQGVYEGYLGVDMMICRGEDRYDVHPCVEVNLRMNMGVVSRLFYDRFLSDGVSGTYAIEYFPNQGGALSFHERMKHDYPVKTNGKRIKSGYLSLSPVFPETSYLIFIIV
jgi:hypothetical protein